MAKPNLRVLKWLGAIPAVAVCTLCDREFRVSLPALKRVTEAQESLRLQFAGHKCTGKNTTADSTSRQG
jgi:hypothetical protein